MDEDLKNLSRDQLQSEVKRLRDGIRAHRDCQAHDLGGHPPDLSALLPEQDTLDIATPEWPPFMRGCIRYRMSLDAQAPAAPRTSADADRR